MFNLLPFIFPPANPPLVDTTFNLRAAAGITEAFRFYEKVLSKLKAVIRGAFIFLSPFSYPPIKQELSSSWKYLEGTFQLSWHSLVPRCERNDLLAWWSWEKLSSVRCSACSWLSLWDWPNHKAAAPASSRQYAPGQPQPLLGRTSIVQLFCCEWVGKVKLGEKEKEACLGLESKPHPPIHLDQQ